MFPKWIVPTYPQYCGGQVFVFVIINTEEEIDVWHYKQKKNM